MGVNRQTFHKPGKIRCIGEGKEKDESRKGDVAERQNIACRCRGTKYDASKVETTDSGKESKSTPEPSSGGRREAEEGNDHFTPSLLTSTTSTKNGLDMGDEGRRVAKG